MQVTTVKATIRKSAEHEGGWSTIELGAEATIAHSDDWRTAQVQLYHHLVDQLTAIWRPGHQAQPAQGQPQASAPANADPSAPTCPRHGRSSQSNHGGLWCPTREDDGRWCSWRHQKPDPRSGGFRDVPPRQS